MKTSIEDFRFAKYFMDFDIKKYRFIEKQPKHKERNVQESPTKLWINIYV